MARWGRSRSDAQAPRLLSPDWDQPLAARAAQTLEQTARTFREIAAASRQDNPALAERLEARANAADEAARRMRAGVAAPPEPPAARAPAASPPATLIVADDHELAREALRSILEREPDLAVVAEAGDGEEVLVLARQLQPDLVLMDLRMPRMDGLQATRALARELPRTKVVVLTSYESREFLMEALRAGAAGYLAKGATKQDVLSTLREVLAGAVRVQPDFAAQLLTEDARAGLVASAPSPQALSPREREVLRLVAQGRTNEEIGQQLHLTLNTVKTHVAHALRKLGAADRTEAAVRAAALGLLEAR